MKRAEPWNWVTISMFEYTVSSFIATKGKYISHHVAKEQRNKDFPWRLIPLHLSVKYVAFARNNNPLF